MREGWKLSVLTKDMNKCAISPPDHNYTSIPSYAIISRATTIGMEKH